MKRLILLMFVLSAALQTAGAQPVELDVRAGLDISTITCGAGRMSAVAGVSAGVNAGYEIWNGIYARTGLGIVSRGGMDERLYSRYSLVCLEIPLTVEYDFPVGSRSALFAECGVWGSCGIGGRIRTEGGTYGAYGSGASNFAEPFDAGLLGGAGVVIDGRVRVGVRYEYGLCNIANEGVRDVLGNCYSNGLCIQIGWMF